jgi:hypothetical protein
VGDSNGGKSGCGMAAPGKAIKLFRICADNVACSDPVKP